MADTEFITIGDEIISGATEDSNFSFAARELVSIGVKPPRSRISVGDNEDDILRAFAQTSADLVVVSGGLGPTPDDLTAACAAAFFKRPLELNAEAFELVKTALRKMKRHARAVHKKQAAVPKGSEIIPNSEGVSPGFICESEGAAFYFLPGPPREFKAMMTDAVVKDILRRSGGADGFFRKTVSVFGIGESEVAEKVGSIGLERVNVAYRLKGNEVQVRVSHTHDPEAVSKAADRIAAHLGENVFSTSGASLREAAAEILCKNNLTVAVAESCTGGMLASQLTDVAGSSRYFRGGAVVYSNESKTGILKIPAYTIEKAGAVSDEVARAMSVAARERFGSDIGIGITGIAGPGGGTFEKPVGTVYIAVSADGVPGGVAAARYEFTGKRSDIRGRSVSQALDIIMKSAFSTAFSKTDKTE